MTMLPAPRWKRTAAVEAAREQQQLTADGDATNTEKIPRCQKRVEAKNKNGGNEGVCDVDVVIMLCLCCQTGAGAGKLSELGDGSEAAARPTECPVFRLYQR